ncbi:hypothetical protein [Aliikangiella coralliicola]|uniref:Uncharacterized protein n=1 Tax=Aliikangiella coralliicola TaxID=2592383 RepID=A0A545UFU7_9GAMM|nr:hypothetical protein [Aliikangiella coralliicola]TQV88348.1 hypothetical protein FLL46_07425 [Aliikangiella coralliicola]
MRLVIFLGVFISAFLSCHSKAESLSYQPGMIVNLGETFDPFAPFESGSLGECFDVTFKNTTPNGQEQYTEGFVSSFSEYIKKTGLSLSGSGSGNFGMAKASASANFKRDREIFQSNKSVVYIVSGTRTYNPQRIKRVKLSDEGKALLTEASTQNDPSIFYMPCGRGIVTSVQKETNISIAYIFTASDSKKTEAIASAISAAVSGVKGKASTTANITSSVKQVDTSATVDTKIFQSGVIDGSDSLKSIIGSQPGDINSVRENLKKAISAISWKSSQIKQFTVDKISRHFKIAKDPDFRYISNLYTNLDKAKTAADRLVERYIQLDDILNADGLAGFKIKKGEVPKIKKERNDIEAKLKDLIKITQTCFEDNKDTCNVPTIDVSFKILDKLDIEFGGFAQWKATAGGAYNSHSERIESNADFWPMFTIRNLKYIDRLEFIQDNTIQLAVLNNAVLSKRINNSILELNEIKLHAQDSQYCWRGRWGEECNPWASDTSRHKNHLKSKHASKSFMAKIIDTEGNLIEIKVPKINSQNY